MIGTMLGNRYEILEKIGEGGMAIVYKAKCHLLNRFVAIKVLKEEYSTDKEFVQKFTREATSVASLSDNNIVNIYDVGSENNINYIVMEYVKGKTLKQIINEEKCLSPYKTVNFASQIARALDCAHKNNIIHRDIKPHNILVTEDGIIKVTDFGIAKAPNSVTITNTNKIMGSAHYFSPEQARGGFVDNRTDIYSLGIVMYEMAVGRVPYDAESPVSVALKHIQEQVVPPKQINPGVPDGLNNLILKAMEKEPIKRYQSAKELLFDLEKLKENLNFNIQKNNFENDKTRQMDPVVINDSLNNKDTDDVDEDDEYEDKGKKPNTPIKKKKKAIILSLIGVLVVALGLIGGYLVSNKKFADTSKNEKTTTVPDIMYMKKADAEKAVKAKGLVFTVSGTIKSDKPEGTVVQVFPSVGSNILVGKEVRVLLSGASQKVTVPDFTKMDLDTAKANINKLGLKLGDISYEFSDTVDKGLIIRQTPDPDTDADNNTVVALVVSNGQEVKMSSVPNVVGSSINDAKAALDNNKLRYNIVVDANNTDASNNGKVASTDPNAGTSVKENSSITVHVYKDYTKPVVTYKMPGLKGKTQEDAMSSLASLKSNLNLNIVTQSVDNTDKTKNGLVANTDPAQDATLTNGQTITLFIYKNAATP